MSTKRRRIWAGCPFSSMDPVAAAVLIDVVNSMLVLPSRTVPEQTKDRASMVAMAAAATLLSGVAVVDEADVVDTEAPTLCDIAAPSTARAHASAPSVQRRRTRTAG